MPVSVVLPIIMLLYAAGETPENPWKGRAPRLIAKAEKHPTAAALAQALDAAWRADDWRAGRKLAAVALEKLPKNQELRGLAARALWRAGRLEEAEHVAAGIPRDTREQVALRTLLEVHLARGDWVEADALADRLEQIRPHRAEDLYYIYAVRAARNELEGLPDLLRRAAKLTDPDNGYPEYYVAEAIEGVPEFLQAVGPRPLNQIASGGAAPMPPLVMLNLPSVDVVIHGRGPYRMVVDTGGSIMLALDQTVADEIGLRSVAAASVRGVAGKEQTGQAVIDELQIGTIRCGRVITRIFDVRKSIMGAADGILGTGIFAEGRMTLDFAGGQLIVGPSSAEPGPGHATEVRIAADAKLMAPVRLEGQPAMALLDTGADVVALSPLRLAELFPDRERQVFDVPVALGVGQGGLPQITLTEGVRLELGGRTFERLGGVGLNILDDTLSPIIGIQTDVLVGMALFREMRSLTVDFPRCRMWIDWLSPKAAPGTGDSRSPGE